MYFHYFHGCNFLWVCDCFIMLSSVLTLVRLSLVRKILKHGALPNIHHPFCHSIGQVSGSPKHQSPAPYIHQPSAKLRAPHTIHHPLPPPTSQVRAITCLVHLSSQHIKRSFYKHPMRLKLRSVPWISSVLKIK